MQRWVADLTRAGLRLLGWSALWVLLGVLEPAMFGPARPEPPRRTGSARFLPVANPASGERWVNDTRPTDEEMVELLSGNRDAAEWLPAWRNSAQLLHPAWDATTRWYVVSSPARGRYCLQGYEADAARPTQWFSREGFTNRPPAESAWLVLHDPRLDAGGPGAATAFDPPQAARIGFGAEPANWQVYLLDGDRLLLVDPLACTVEPLMEVRGARALMSAREMDELPDAHGRSWRYLSGDVPHRIVAVLGEREVAMWRERDHSVQHVPLPPALLGTRCRLGAMVWIAQVLVIGPAGEAWLCEADAATRQALTLTTRFAPLSRSRRLAVGTFPLLPLLDALPRLRDADDTVEVRCTRLVFECRSALPLWLLLGLIAAGHVVWRHRRYGLRGVPVWAVFVALGGVPGWLAWRFGLAWPTLVVCSGCGLETPASRRACRRCELPLAHRRPWRARDRELERPVAQAPPWRCVAWKEWRELAPAVIVALAALVYWGTWLHGVELLQPSPLATSAEQFRTAAALRAPRELITSWNAFTTSLAPLVAAIALLLGLWQGWSDGRQRMGPWLRTRAVSRYTIAATRVAMGLLAVELLTLLPTLLLVAWSLKPGCYAAPFVWSLPARALLLGLATPWCWIGGWLAAARPARWFGARLFPLLGVAAILAVAGTAILASNTFATPCLAAALTALAVIALVPWVAWEAA